MPKRSTLALRIGLFVFIMVLLTITVGWVFGRRGVQELTVRLVREDAHEHATRVALETDMGLRMDELQIDHDDESAAIFTPEGDLITTLESDYIFPDVSPEVWANLIASETGSYYDLISGYVYGISLNPSETLYVVVAAEPNAIDTAVISYQQSTLRAVLAGLVLVAIVSVIGVWGLVGQPIRLMTEKAESMRDGDLSARINTDHMFDELLVLAETINELASQQQTTISKLEATVNERTASLQEANERLSTLNDMKDAFVSNVSHELKTPVTSLRITAHMLEQQPERSDEYLPRLQREIDRLGTLIEDLLFLSRLDQARVDFSPQAGDPKTLVEHYVLDRQLLAEQKGVHLRAQTTPLDTPVLYDEGLIGQALSIFMTNAINYTPQGGQVTVKTEPRDDKWVGVTVQDTGPGIPQEEQERIFKRFYRGNAAHQTREPGTGLGLAIAREIAEKHGGHISLTSELGKGATFTLWLPPAA